jgi:hypothetical protein
MGIQPIGLVHSKLAVFVEPTKQIVEPIDYANITQ